MFIPCLTLGFGENNFLLSNNISVTEIAKAIIEAAMIHYVTKKQF